LADALANFWHTLWLTLICCSSLHYIFWMLICSGAVFFQVEIIFQLSCFLFSQTLPTRYPNASQTITKQSIWLLVGCVLDLYADDFTRINCFFKNIWVKFHCHFFADITRQVAAIPSAHIYHRVVTNKRTAAAFAYRAR